MLRQSQSSMKCDNLELKSKLKILFKQNLPICEAVSLYCVRNCLASLNKVSFIGRANPPSNIIMHVCMRLLSGCDPRGTHGI